MSVHLQDSLWLILFTASFYCSGCQDLGPVPVPVDSTEVELTPFLGTTGQLESDLADNAILKPDGTVWAWGNNFTGQLGDGTMNPSADPKQILTLKHIISIDFCEGGALALAHNGSVWFWGNRLLWEELPAELDTTVTLPRKIAFLPGAVQILAGDMDFYLLRDDGTVWVLHWDNYSPTRFLTPERVAGLEAIAAISGNLALKKDGTVRNFPTDFGWGADHGSMGSWTLQNAMSIQNRPHMHSLVLKTDGTVWSWGNNAAAGLGNGSLESNPVPTPIDTLKGVTAISTNGARCAALCQDGTAWFWGLIDLQQFQTRPTRIDTMADVDMVFASGVWPLLLRKKDGTYWSYDVKTADLRRLNL